MKETSQFIIRGAVTGVRDMATPKGTPLVHIHLEVAGYKQGTPPVPFRVEAYDKGLIAAAHALRPGQRVQCAGRLTGRVTDKGFYNYSLYADSLLIEPSTAVPPAAAPSASPAPAPARRPAEADEDIPF